MPKVIKISISGGCVRFFVKNWPTCEIIYFTNPWNNGKFRCKYDIHWICEKKNHIEKNENSTALAIGRLERWFFFKSKNSDKNNTSHICFVHFGVYYSAWNMCFIFRWVMERNNLQMKDISICKCSGIDSFIVQKSK